MATTPAQLTFMPSPRTGDCAGSRTGPVATSFPSDWLPAPLRAPDGGIQDVIAYYYAGRPYYDPARIEAPTLLVSPHWDNDTPPCMARALLAQLPARSTNRLEILPERTHTMLMECHRLRLFECVQDFLAAPPGPRR